MSSLKRLKAPGLGQLRLALASVIAHVFIISYMSLKNRLARKIFAGEPTIVIQNGKILEQNMAKMRYDLDHLNHQLRQKGIFDISHVEFAIIEPCISCRY